MTYFLEMFNDHIIFSQQTEILFYKVSIFLLVFAICYTVFHWVCFITDSKRAIGLVVIVYIVSELFIMKGLNIYEQRLISKSLESFYITSETYTYEVEFLPNQVVNIDSNYFIIDGKKVQISSYDETKYLNENISKPYIVVSKYKVEFVGKTNICLNQKNIDRYLKTFNNYELLEEVHY